MTLEANNRQTHTYRCINQSNFKKPGAHWPAANMCLVVQEGQAILNNNQMPETILIACTCMLANTSP